MKKIMIVVVALQVALVCGGCGRGGSQAAKAVGKIMNSKAGYATRKVAGPAAGVLWGHSSHNPNRCDACEGNGRVWNEYANDWMKCPYCDGKGHK